MKSRSVPPAFLQKQTVPGGWILILHICDCIRDCKLRFRLLGHDRYTNGLVRRVTREEVQRQQRQGDQLSQTGSRHPLGRKLTNSTPLHLCKQAGCLSAAPTGAAEVAAASRATAMAERSRVPVSRLFNNARGFVPHLGRKFKNGGKRSAGRSFILGARVQVPLLTISWTSPIPVQKYSYTLCK